MSLLTSKVIQNPFRSQKCPPRLLGGCSGDSKENVLFQWTEGPEILHIAYLMFIHVSLGVQISDRDRHFFSDPSSSISDRSQIDLTGTKPTLLCIAVLMYSHLWREVIYSRSWHYKTGFYNYNTNNRLILARHVGWGMRSSYFIRIFVKQLLAISETMTDQIVWKV